MARPVVADTDVLIDYQTGEGAAATVRRLVTAGRLRVPAIAYYELMRGATDQASRETVRRLLHGAPVLALSRQDVDAAADIWRQLTPHQRDMLGDRDILIAGAAMARGCPLLTRNRQHFAATGVRLHSDG